MKKIGENRIMRIGLLHSTIRAEEKLLIEAARARNIELKLIDIRKEISLVHTQGQINDSRLNKHEKDISQNTQDIKQLYSRE